MRDPSRIDRMLPLLEQWWRMHPENAYPYVGDPYYMEDEDVERMLHAWLDNAS